MGGERDLGLVPASRASVLGSVLSAAIEVSAVPVAHASVRHDDGEVAVHRGGAVARTSVEHTSPDGRLVLRLEGDAEPQRLLDLASRLAPHLRVGLDAQAAGAATTTPDATTMPDATTTPAATTTARQDGAAAEFEHRLRTRLTVARGWVELLRAERVDPGREAQALDTTSRQLIGIEALLRERSTTSTAGPADAAPGRVDLAVAVRRAVRDCAWILEPHIEGPLIRGVARELPVCAAAVEDVLMHLLDNASEHTEPGTRIEVLLSFEPDLIRLSVEDAGPGFPDDLSLRFGVGMRVIDRLATTLGAAVKRGRSPRLGGAAVHLLWFD
jgi:signal transduction histidine kinase